MTFAFTYWFSDLVKSYIFVHRGNASVIRFFTGFQSDLKTTAIVFFIEISVTFFSSIYLNEYIYPIVDTILPGIGQLILVFSSLVLFFAFLLDNESNSYPNVLFALRSISIIMLIIATSTNETLNSLHGHWDSSWYQNPAGNTTVNETLNATNRTG